MRSINLGLIVLVFIIFVILVMEDSFILSFLVTARSGRVFTDLFAAILNIAQRFRYYLSINVLAKF